MIWYWTVRTNEQIRTGCAISGRWKLVEKHQKKLKERRNNKFGPLGSIVDWLNIYNIANVRKGSEIYSIHTYIQVEKWKFLSHFRRKDFFVISHEHKDRFFVVIWPIKTPRHIKYWPRIDPFFSKNQNFDPKHKIPKNQWEKLNRFHYCQISKFWFFKSALLLSDQFWANILYVREFLLAKSLQKTCLYVHEKL